eukprot:365679_1
MKPSLPSQKIDDLIRFVQDVESIKDPDDENEQKQVQPKVYKQMIILLDDPSQIRQIEHFGYYFAISNNVKTLFEANGTADLSFHLIRSITMSRKMSNIMLKTRDDMTTVLIITDKTIFNPIDKLPKVMKMNVNEMKTYLLNKKYNKKQKQNKREALMPVKDKNVMGVMNTMNIMPVKDQNVMGVMNTMNIMPVKDQNVMGVMNTMNSKNMTRNISNEKADANITFGSNIYENDKESDSENENDKEKMYRVKINLDTVKNNNNPNKLTF